MILQNYNLFYTMPAPTARKITLLILQEVLEKKHNLDQAFAKYLRADQRENAWIKSLCFGILKKLSSLDFILSKFAKKPLGPKDQILKLIIYIGLYQLLFMETKAHAAIFETVELTKQKYSYASGFVNALLQNVARMDKTVLNSLPPEATYNHPDWLLTKIKTQYPQEWPVICEANNEHPPLFLRVNKRKTTREDYLKILDPATQAKACLYDRHATCIELQIPVDTKKLPQFSAGYVSVQDLAAQQAAFLLELQDGQTILDACAAPGGKASHILETANVKLYALDHDVKRLERVRDNFKRLDLDAEIMVADASQINFPLAHFDRILLDAPCSGTGVIRRHPDIRFLRRESDLGPLTQNQKNILTHLWPMLKPGGILLYATCSILAEENDAIIDAFLQQNPEAILTPLHFEIGKATQHGWQFLPSAHGPDGFYYAKLVRR